MNWLLNNLGVVGDYLLSHLGLALPPIVASFILAIPLGWLPTVSAGCARRC